MLSSKTLGAAGMILLLAGGAALAALLSENWNSGTINPSIWNYAEGDAGQNIVLEDPLGNGDYALALKGTQDGGDPEWGQDYIYSQATFTRRTNLYVRFKLWIKPGINAQIGFHGGWHRNSDGVVYGWTDDAGTSPEAHFDYVYSSLGAWERGDGVQIFNPHTVISSAFNAAVAATNSKANAIDIRIMLDATQGARWEYSTDGGGAWNVIRDTLGTGTSTDADNYVGFGPFHQQAGTAMIDDIVVDVLPPIIFDVGNGVLVDEDRTLEDSYTLVLDGTPTHDVTVTVDPDDQLEVNDAGAGNPIQLVFTPATAGTPKTVTVKAIDDSDPEDPHTGLISHTLASDDANFDGIDAGDLPVSIIDNDPFCGMQGQVYTYFDYTGPQGVPDCYVDLYDLAAMTNIWLLCTDLSDPQCSWEIPY